MLDNIVNITGQLNFKKKLKIKKSQHGISSLYERKEGIEIGI